MVLVGLKRGVTGGLARGELPGIGSMRRGGSRGVASATLSSTCERDCKVFEGQGRNGKQESPGGRDGLSVGVSSASWSCCLEGVEGGEVVGQVFHSEVVALQWAGDRQAGSST